MKIPSTDLWSREEFLSARNKQAEAARNQELHPLGKLVGKKVELIVIDMGNKVVCDSCNVEIVTKHIRLVAYGRRAVCDDCFTAWYADEPLTFRELMPNGTLSSLVTSD